MVEACSTRSAVDCPHAQESAREAVKLTFSILGVNVDEPKEVEEFRRDLRFAGDLRKDIHDSKKLALKILLTAVLTAILGYMGFKVSGG
jgi:hypothetical protein